MALDELPLDPLKNIGQQLPIRFGSSQLESKDRSRGLCGIERELSVFNKDLKRGPFGDSIDCRMNMAEITIRPHKHRAVLVE